MKTSLNSYISLFVIAFFSFSSCKIQKEKNALLLQKTLPTVYEGTETGDSTNTAHLNWKEFFTDSHLLALIDSALANNLELKMVNQEILIVKEEIRAKKGEYLPFVGLKVGAGIDKSGRYTRTGAFENNNSIVSGQPFPDPYSDLLLGANFSWELDVWKKLRNAKQATFKRYLSSIEGRKFLETQLVCETAKSYYELIALENQLEILQNNILLQQDALETVKIQKIAAQATELAVKKFQAEVLKNQSKVFFIQQNIKELENNLCFLTGNFPEKIKRNSAQFTELQMNKLNFGIPSQLLKNRPDILRAELEIEAAKLDVKSAKANFYPSLKITSGLGYQAFNSSFLFNPQSLIYNLAGDLVAPLINRNAIKATYNQANHKQLQTLFSYQQTVLNAFIEVQNQLSKTKNLEQSFQLKAEEVQTLNQSISIANNLFKSARADYMEVLLTQRDALDAKIELVEIKLQQMNTQVDVYRVLGGGW